MNLFLRATLCMYIFTYNKYYQFCLLLRYELFHIGNGSFTLSETEHEDGNCCAKRSHWSQFRPHPRSRPWSRLRSRSVRVPTRTGKPGKMGRHFQSGKSQGTLNRLEKSGKITQNTGKLWEFEINIT